MTMHPQPGRRSSGWDVIQAKLKFATLSQDGTVMGLTVLRDCSNA